jgi:hypothetical protein
MMSFSRESIWQAAIAAEWLAMMGDSALIGVKSGGKTAALHKLQDV